MSRDPGQGFNVGLGVLPLADDPLDGGDQDWLRLVVSAADDAREILRSSCWGPLQPAAGPDPAASPSLLLTSLSQGDPELEEGFHLVYQPKIDLPTGRCTGVEALAALAAPATRLRPAPPNSCPWRRKPHRCAPSSDWVLRHAMAQLAQWNARNIPLMLAISRAGIGHGRRQLPGRGRQNSPKPTSTIDLSALELEFTESVLIRDASAVGSVLLRAPSLSMGIAVDDFGTGYSNWTYLRDLANHRHQARPIVHPRPRRLAEGAQSVTQAVIGLASQLGHRGGRGRHRDPRHLPPAASLGLGTRARAIRVAQPMLPEQLEDWLRRWPTQAEVEWAYQHARQPRRVAQGLASKAQTR
ncbi:EAL domain-containing protein [Pseudomonas aeruginosa]